MQRASAKDHLLRSLDDWLAWATGSSVARRLMPIWPFVALMAVVLAVFWPILFSHYTLYPFDILHELFVPFAAHRPGLNVQATSHIDYVDTYYPVRSLIWERLRRGQLPLWNPYIRGGYPTFASQGSLVVLDVFNALFLVLDLPRALAWRAFLQVLFCGLFMYLYLRGLQIGRFAAWVGSVGLAFNSMFWANVFDWSLGSVLWWPLVLWLLDRAHDSRRLTWSLLAGLVMGVGLLASPLQLVVYMVFTVLAVSVLRFFVLERRGGIPLATLALPVLLTVVIGLLIASVQLLPATELVLWAPRIRGWSPRSLPKIALNILAHVSFVFPNLVGRFRYANHLFEFWGSSAHFRGYIGIFPFVFATIATFALRERRKWIYVLIASFALVSPFTPLRSYLYERFLIVYIFYAAVLAALGADRLVHGKVNVNRAKRVLRVLLVVFCLILLSLAVGNVIYAIFRAPIDALAEQLLKRRMQTHYSGYAVPLYLWKMRNTLTNFSLLSPTMYVPLSIGFASLGFVWALLQSKLHLTVLKAIAIALIGLDLIYATTAQIPYVDLRSYPPFPSHPLIERMQQDKGLFRVAGLRWGTQEPMVLSGMMWIPYHLQGLGGFDNFCPLDVSRLARAPEGWPDVWQLEVNPKVLNVQNVKYLLVNERRTLDSRQFRLIETRDDTRLYENTQVLPRAFFVSDYVVVPDCERAIEMLNSPEFDPARTVILEHATDLPNEPATEGPATVTIVDYQAESVRIAVDAPRSGFLVLSDTYYPGWKATVDGRPSTILRANGAMRAIFVDAGEHWVRFAFEPSTFRAGLLISISAAVLAAILVVIGFLRRV